MLQALQKHDKVLQVTTLQKVAIKNVILSGNPVGCYMVISENDLMITQNQFPWYLLPKYMGAIHSTKIQNSDQSDREKRTTSKGGPVFSKLFRLDRTDPLSFGPKFPEILVEWIAPHVL